MDDLYIYFLNNIIQLSAMYFLFVWMHKYALLYIFTLKYTHLYIMKTEYNQ